MLKETHTISYIQQAGHEWIEEDEKEIAYAQATESLKVVPTNIQHGPEVLYTTTYCAFLQKAKQKIGRVCEAKTTCHICDATRIAPCGSPTIANL